MASTNSYQKHYLTNCRSTIEEKYVLVLFKSDNTFIIRKKSNLPGVDENGLVNIKDRGKTYAGYCLFEGSREEIEAAAERLDKEMNTDLESDCEAVVSVSKTNRQQSRQNSTATVSKTNLSKANTATSGSSVTKNNSTQKKNDTNTTQPRIQSLASTNLDVSSTNYKTPPPTNTSVHNKRAQETSIERNTNSAHGLLRSINNIQKNTTNVRPTERFLTFDDDFSEEESDDDDRSIESAIDLDSLLPSTSTTNNRNNVRSSKRSLSKTSTRKTLEKGAKRFCNNSSSSEDHGNKEIIMLLKPLLLSVADLAKDVYQSSKDIKNLVVSVDKSDKKLNVVYENQKKMQRALSKKKIDVALNGGEFGDENIIVGDTPFQSTLVYMNSNGESFDLLQLHGSHAHMGRYVACVMDKIFTKEEITTITKDQLLKDERYLIIKEAARSKFKLNYQMLNSEWSTLHECILQKRRNEWRNAKKDADNVPIVAAPQAQEQDDFNE